MSADGHLALCESLARTTRRMRVAAERADWDTLVAGGDECATLIERLRSGATPALDDASRRRKAQLLREMLADDRLIRERTQPELTRLAAMLNVSRKAADAAARYGPAGYEDPREAREMPNAQPVAVDAALAHCQVNTRFEVVSLLREVLASHALLTIYFNDGADAIVSTLLEVNPDFEELVIDCGADKKANARLLESPRLVAVTFVDHIRIQFWTARAQTTTYQGAPAFRIRVPDSVLRLQRRNAYRVRVPMANPATLSIVHPTRPEETLKLKLLDISVGGIAVLATPDDFEWEDGIVLEGCKVDLPEFGDFTCELEVRYSLLLAETGRTQLKRYGLQFRALGTASALVQRYILFIERSRHK